MIEDFKLDPNPHAEETIEDLVELHIEPVCKTVVCKQCGETIPEQCCESHKCKVEPIKVLTRKEKRDRKRELYDQKLKLQGKLGLNAKETK